MSAISRDGAAMAAEILQTPDASRFNSEIFDVGSIVHVSPDTSPGVHGRHACGFTARITGHLAGGYLLRNVLSDRGRSIFIAAKRVSKGCVDCMSNSRAIGDCDLRIGVKRALTAEKLIPADFKREAATLKEKCVVADMCLAKKNGGGKLKK